MKFKYFHGGYDSQEFSRDEIARAITAPRPSCEGGQLEALESRIQLLEDLLQVLVEAASDETLVNLARARGLELVIP